MPIPSQPQSDSLPTADSSTPSAEITDTRRRAAAVTGGGLLLLGIALAAANMRPAVTSLASVLGETRAALGASPTWASVITAVPTLCFGAAGITAPKLARRWGVHKVVGSALAVLTAAMIIRVLDGPGLVLAGTFAVCGAIAMCNVLIPVVVKESFPNRVGFATGMYTSTMAAGGALGSALTPSFISITGSWEFGLATWSVLALAACCVWVASGTGGFGDGQSRVSDSSERRSLLRSPLAWVVTGYFAMQSLIAYVVMGWLPEVFKGAGMEATTAGLLLGYLLVLGVPISMVLPPLASRSKNQSGWAIGLASLTFTGVLGTLIAPLAMPLLWVTCIGIGISAFPLALTFISLRTRDAADTAALSAMSQSIGYLIASTGPFLFGVLHDLTEVWSASLVALLGVIVTQAVIGAFAGRARTV